MLKRNSLINDLLLVIAPPLVVLLLHTLRVFVMPIYNQLDVLAHFLGGASIALSTLIVYLIFSNRKLLPEPMWFTIFVMICVTALVGVLWEIYEWLWFHAKTEASQLAWWTDTIGDLTMDLTGAAFTSLILYLKRR